MSEQQFISIYDQIGAETIEELVNAFYPKVYEDPDLIPLFADVEVNEVMRKQTLFLTQFTGGPSLFSQEFGAPMMRARHAPHEITRTRAVAWLKCMEESFKEIGLWGEPIGEAFFNRLKQVAEIMINTAEDESD